jgi:hypothetical protein
VAACHLPHLLVPFHFVPPSKSNITSLNTVLFRPNGISLPGMPRGRAQLGINLAFIIASSPRVFERPLITTPPDDILAEPIKLATEIVGFLQSSISVQTYRLGCQISASTSSDQGSPRRLSRQMSSLSDVILSAVYWMKV